MRLRTFVLVAIVLFVFVRGDTAQDSPSKPDTGSLKATHLGFDRNDYPGDGNLALLRKSFSFAGYWLNSPPGAMRNTWTGKREVIRQSGFGFLILFNGRLYAELKKSGKAAELGKSDGAMAAASARQEGFPIRAVIFLDLEEGGRMLPEQKAYIYAWVDTVNANGFRAGVYCSGIPVSEGHGVSVVTANDIQRNANGRDIVYWIANDACPPSPGCAYPARSPKPSDSGLPYAEVWQYAQSPRRKDVARACTANYSRDGNCYPPGTAKTEGLFVDLNSSWSEDPSGGR